MEMQHIFFLTLYVGRKTENLLQPLQPHASLKLPSRKGFWKSSHFVFSITDQILVS